MWTRGCAGGGRLSFCVGEPGLAQPDGRSRCRRNLGGKPTRCCTACSASRRGAAHVVESPPPARPVFTRVGSSTCLETRFTLDNDVALIPVVVTQLEEELRCICPDEGASQDVGVALREALANAIYHGNLELSSDLREEDGGRPYDELAARRRRTPPYCDRRVAVLVRRTDEELVCVVTDEGPGFDPASLPDPMGADFLDRPHGRGLLLIRSLMDEVAHNERGNVITMVKRLEA